MLVKIQCRYYVVIETVSNDICTLTFFSVDCYSSANNEKLGTTFIIMFYRTTSCNEPFCVIIVKNCDRLTQCSIL